MLSPPYSTYSRSDVGSPRPRGLFAQTDRHESFGGVLDNGAGSRNPKTPRQRVKASHQKVRTGCLRCKQRRIKCDETQPACLRCLRINEFCPGYQQPITRIFGLATLEGFETDFEKACFDSFFAGGSSRLALFQPSTKSFWITILPQLCQVYLPLRHGAIALAYVNEPFYNHDLGTAARSRDAVDTLGVVMTHFNTSLRGFIEDMDRLSIEAKVSCCIVFTALTIYMYRVGAVSSHVSAALNFLRQHERARGHGDPALKQVLAPSIRRLAIDACTFSGGMSGFQQQDRNPYEEYMYEVLQVPQTFDTCEDAYEVLCNLLKYAIAMSVGNIEHGSRSSAHLQSTLRRFEIVLSKSRITSYDGKQLSEEYIDFHRRDLLLQHRTARLISGFRPEMLECSYHVFGPEFQAVFDQIRELMKSEPEDPWRITLGWLPPLFLIATKCRVPTLRREALQMMHQLHRIERGWTSCVAYALAKFVIDQEETSLPQGIVAVHNTFVHLSSVRFDHNGQAADVKYLLQRDQTSLGVFSAHLPMKALSRTLTRAPAMNVPDPVLQAFGYTGTTMFSPRAACHCHDSGSPVTFKGRITETGKEEVVVWEAGLATFKTVKEKDYKWFQRDSSPIRK